MYNKLFVLKKMNSCSPVTQRPLIELINIEFRRILLS